MVMIKVLDLVKVINRDLEQDGLPLDTKVIVAGVQAFPISKEDPYTQRVKLYVQKLNETGDGVEEGLYLIDPASVEQTGLRAVQEDEDSEEIATVN
jgi:hypothetical protein